MKEWKTRGRPDKNEVFLEKGENVEKATVTGNHKGGMGVWLPGRTGSLN